MEVRNGRKRKFGFAGSWKKENQIISINLKPRERKVLFH